MITGWIGEAKDHWQRVPATRHSLTKQIDVHQMSQWLGRPVVTCQLWKANWRNQIYRITFGDGSRAVAKRNRVGETRELDQEFRVLQELDRLPLGEALRTPTPIAYWRKHRTYVMGFVPGTSLDVLVTQAAREPLINACRLAGEALATLHQLWTKDIREIPTEELLADLTGIPLRLSSYEMTKITTAIHRLRGVVVPLGQPFLDYKPANLLYEGNRIGLIDPPEQRFHSEIMLWDIAVFERGLRHQLLQSAISPRRHWLVDEGIRQFEKSYRQANQSALSPDSFRLLVQIMELQRLGQLLALQAGKIKRYCSSEANPVCRCVASGRFYVTLPILAFQARRLIRRMDS